MFEKILQKAVTLINVLNQGFDVDWIPFIRALIAEQA